MTTIVTRAGKGSPLTHTEVDTNFTNLNTNKFETAAIPLGTLAAPSISFVGRPNTGIYSPGADTLAFVTAGSNRVHITSGGLVGIGSSSPSSKLEIGGATNGSALTFSCTSSNPATERLLASVDYKTAAVGSTTMFAAYSVVGFADNASTLRFYTDAGTGTQQERLRISHTGAVGIGNTGPSQKLHITDSSAAFTRYESGSFDAYVGQRSTGILEIAQAQAGNITFLNNGSERARIDSSGRLLVGTTTTTSAGELLRVKKASTGTDGAGINFEGSYSLDDDASQTVSIASSSLITITNENELQGALLFATYASATITIISDPSNIIATSDTDTKLCLFKSANTSNVTVKNRLGANKSILIGRITT